MKVHVLFLIPLFEICNALSNFQENKPGTKPRKAIKDLLNQDYQELYREMMRNHYYSAEDGADDEFRLRRIVGDDNFEVIKGGIANRRRSQIRSVVGKRRARSQALRRDKLNSQSLRSHFEHTRQSSDASLEIN